MSEYVLINADRMKEIRQDRSKWTLHHEGAFATITALIALCDGPIYFGDQVIAAFLQTKVRKWHELRDEMVASGILSLTDKGYPFVPDEANLLKFPGKGRKSLPSEVRNIARRRTQECCVYCGTLDGPFQHDHLLPLSLGGSNEPNNIVLACRPCNLSKGSKTLLEWTADLRRRGAA